MNVKRLLDDMSAYLDSQQQHTTRVYADGTVSQDTPLPVQHRWDIFRDRRHKKVAKDEEGNMQFIVLQDVTQNHQYSNVVDIKLGSVQYAEQNTTEEKMQHLSPHQRAKLERAAKKCGDSTSAEFGFRINGMQIFREDKRVYKVVDKYVCRKLDIVKTEAMLERFLKYPTWDNLPQVNTLIDVSFVFFCCFCRS